MVGYVFFVVLTGLAIFAGISAGRDLNRYLRGKRYREGHPDYQKTFLISGTFASRTLAGFKVEYVLTLQCERIDNKEFNREKMLKCPAQARLAEAYNEEVFAPFWNGRSCFFHLDLHPGVENGKPFDAIPKAAHLNEAGLDNMPEILDFSKSPIRNEIETLPPWKRNGCEVVLQSLKVTPLSYDIGQENYAMLTNSQKELIQKNQHYGAIREQIAVAALKLRLDVLDSNEQRHETEALVIETTKAGRGLKIKWSIDQSLSGDSELLGFRNTGGFFHDKWSETHNGILIVHSQIDGHVVEFLPEGEPTFYTFFLKKCIPEKNGNRKVGSSIRFQVTMAPKDEMEEIQKALDHSEGGTMPDPKMDKVIGELGLVMEFHDAMDVMEQSLVAKIKGKKLPPEEEEEKIAFVRDMVRLQREKYQPG